MSLLDDFEKDLAQREPDITAVGQIATQEVLELLKGEDSDVDEIFTTIANVIGQMLAPEHMTTDKKVRIAAIGGALAIMEWLEC